MNFVKKEKSRVRNAGKARNTFVTRRTEMRISLLGDLFKAAAGDHWVRTAVSVLRRDLFFSGYYYLDSFQLIYNWENRFMAVNYNLQIASSISAERTCFEEIGAGVFTLRCVRKGIRGERIYSWEHGEWGGGDALLEGYLERLSNPLITSRLDALDLMEMELRYRPDRKDWRISCESLIGSATWLLIPPVLSMIMPKPEECVKFLELYELLGDALVNNRQGKAP